MELDKLKRELINSILGFFKPIKMDSTAIHKTRHQRRHQKAEAQLKNGVIFRSNLDVLKAELVKLNKRN